MIDIKVTIPIDDKTIVDITPKTDLYELIISLKNKGVKIISEDPDNCIISRKIYEKIFYFYDENIFRGDTLNTYNWTFGKSNNYRLLNILEKENISNNSKVALIEKVNCFKHIYHSIGNFTVLERWHKNGEAFCINGSRGTGSLRDSWPLTLLCIQDYISSYSKLEKNPLKYSFENNKDTIQYFSRYRLSENGFELFCDDHYFSPNLYDNKIEYGYVCKSNNGNYEVNLDLFDGLCFEKPLPENIQEIEQYIERTTKKIVERGKIILSEYGKSANVT